MKKSIKQRLTAIAASVAVIGGFGLVAAPAAQAYTIYKTEHVAHRTPSGFNCARYAWIDYSWGEEVFGGYKDGRYFVEYVSGTWCLT